METKSNYKYGILDPRNSADSIKNNEDLLLGNVLGIEVTVPTLAKRCSLGNIDPQHTQGIELAAIEACNEIQLPENGARLVTVRPDLDSIGSMALLEMRAEIRSGNLDIKESDATELVSRISRIAKVDGASKLPWRPTKLPSSQEQWPDTGNGLDKELVALSAMVSDFALPLELRVSQMRDWLLTGVYSESAKYIDKVTQERADLVKAIASGEINISCPREGIAAVYSSHRGAMQVGYSYSPIVVAVNKKFQIGDGEPHVKITIAQFTEGHADFEAIKARLSEREPGWGGSKSILGSPQGVSSKLSLSEIFEIVEDERLKVTFGEKTE